MDNVEKMSGEELVSALENINFECGEWSGDDAFDYEKLQSSTGQLRIELLHRLTEYDRLKKIVEDAPHSRDCPSEATTYKTVDGPPICSLPCWKKEITP